MKAAKRSHTRGTMVESERREFKKGLAELKEGLVSIAAILNKHGKGEVWFGVRNDGYAVGLDVNEKTLRDLSQAIASHIEPRIFPQIKASVLGGAQCIRVSFSGRETPYLAYGRAYVRVADEDRQMSAKELERFILARNRDAVRFDIQPTKMKFRDLDAARVERFLRQAELTLEKGPGGMKNALEKLGLFKDGAILQAAALFFAKAPAVELRCAVFAGTTSATILDQHDYHGDILEMIEEGQKYILKNIHIGMRLDGMRRVDVPEIAPEALREAVINAFCHRDWLDPETVRVAIYADRVEIRNPGALPEGLTIAQLRKGHISRRRNPLVADLLRRVHLVEGWGRGMPLILDKAPQAEFEDIAGIFIARFGRPKGVAHGTAEETAQESASGTKETLRKHQENAKEARIVDAIRAMPSVSVRELAGSCGLTTDSALHYIKKLKTAGRLRRIGPDKGGHWEVQP